ncbi:MAG: patatin-like phospholipase family protein [Planctomycetota bacterium]
MYRILTFDGGGILGLFTARVLECLETERPGVVAGAELFAGTSTGSIIALGLASGKTPSDLVKLYLERGPAIFAGGGDGWFAKLRNLIKPRYTPKGLRHALTAELGNGTLGDLQRRVLVPTFDLKIDRPTKRPVWAPKFFHNFSGSDSDADWPIVDVAMASAAAPTYFPSHRGFIDGAMVAGNPTMAAVAQALDSRSSDMPAAGRRLADLSVLSIGTGTSPRHEDGDALRWGQLKWAGVLPSLMMSGMSGVADYQCRQLLGDRYRRIDAEYPEPVEIDDASDSAMQAIITAADGVDLGPILSWLETAWN